jgi:AraC-like DNA-binding protein
MRHGAFCKHLGRRSLTADVNQAVFFSKGSTYRVSHPADCGDRGTVFEAAAPVLHDIAARFDPSVHDRPDRPFRFVTGPCPRAVFWGHHAFIRRLESTSGEQVEPLYAEGVALQLMAGALEAAFIRNGGSPARRRASTNFDHAEGTEAAKGYLASRLSERITLENVARAVHMSPFHLARVFQERTGLPIHRYLIRLRLRASLERLADAANDLTALALGLGFSSHSHFSDAFRREFGRTPSDARRAANRRSLREMSKNLEV